MMAAMITPSPTTKIAPYLTRGVLSANHPATATKPATVIVEVPNTSYQLHLVPAAPVTSPIGKRTIGIIRVDARRVDVVKSGGRYVEPVAGRPRRVQGAVIARDASANTITVSAGVPIVLKLTDTRQRAEQFADGDFVSCDVLDGATYTPQDA